MQNRNYQKELEKILGKIKAEKRKPRLCLHSCCAPCSSYILEYLAEYFEITVFYYNPNIAPKEEYQKRVIEQQELIRKMSAGQGIYFCEGQYDSGAFYQAVKGLEHIAEGGTRCEACFALRLEAAARKAKEGGFDYFTTTLSISPLKNAEKLNAIGEAMGEKYQMRHLPCDFKKKGGYQRSVQLSKEYELYRQDYCGCIFSKKEREKIV